MDTVVHQNTINNVSLLHPIDYHLHNNVIQVQIFIVTTTKIDILFKAITSN